MQIEISGRTLRGAVPDLLRIGVTALIAWLVARGYIPSQPPSVDPPPPIYPVPPHPIEPEPEPVPPPKVEPKIKADPLAATARFSKRNKGCTCTLLSPEKTPGYVPVLTAAHCADRVGDSFTVTLKDGRKYTAVCKLINRSADIAIGVIQTKDVLPFAVIAKEDPPIGTVIWHQGYGVNKPGNYEEGKVASLPKGNGQIQMDLSVSSGDSGSGIFRKDNGEIISVVCCTDFRRNTYGGCPSAIWSMIGTVANDLEPISD
jgi:hypothetical protein